MKGITLFSLFNLALKHIVLLIVAAVVFAAGAFAYCEFVAVPQYSATGSVLVTNGAIDKSTIDEFGNTTKIDNTDVSASINFMDTACKMLRQNDIYKQLAKKIDNRYSYGALKGMSEVSRTEDHALYIDITFKANSREEAINLISKSAIIKEQHSGTLFG